MADDLIKLLVVPSLGLSVEEVTVVGWLISEGDSFQPGDEICELETEKTVNAMEAPFAGTLRQIVAEVGEILPVQATLALVADVNVSDEQISEFLANHHKQSSEVGVPQVPGVEVTEQQPESAEPLPASDSNADVGFLATGDDDSTVHATPRARMLASSAGLNLHHVSGTGRNRRISRRDVEGVLAQSGVVTEQPQQTYPAGNIIAQHATSGAAMPLSSMRRKIAGRLQQSKQVIPHYRLVIDVNVDALLLARRELNIQSKKKVSINDFIIKACAHALIEVPDINIQFDGEKVYQHSDADIAVAVALDDGLITPVIRAAQRKSLIDIASQSRDLVGRAKSASLKPDEYQGGTFCISNLGMYGIRQFDAIINPPHGAILAVGAVRECVVVADGQPNVANILTLTLSCDHRVIDGATGARYLAAAKRILEIPTEISA